MPALLNSANNNKPRACGGGPSSCSAAVLSRGFSASPIDRAWMSDAGCRGDVDSVVCVMVVVAVVSDPARPLRLWCVSSVCGSDRSGLELSEFVGSGGCRLGVASVVDTEVLVLMGESKGLLSLWLVYGVPDMKGLPVVIVVETDWFRDNSVDWAARWRVGIMEGPGRRWAFVRCAHVAIARGPRVYWDWIVSVQFC